MPWIETTPEGVLLRLRVIPRAGRDGVQGPHAERLKIRLQAPPVDGKANQALLKFLSKQIGLPLSRLTLVAGATSREKSVRVSGMGGDEVRARLWPGEEDGT